MTYPVTPDPSIHKVPARSRAQDQQQIINQLRTLFLALPKAILSQVVAFIKQTTGIDLSGLLNFLEGVFGGINLLNPPSPAEIWRGVVQTLIQPLNLLIGPNSLLGHLFRQLQAPEVVNLLPASAFASGSITDNTLFTVDLGHSRSSDGSGAAKVIADGELKTMTSGTNPQDVIVIAPGATVSGTVFASHEGYEGTGVAIRLLLVPFADDGEPGEPIELASYAPASADMEWPGFELTGSETLPEEVVGVQLRIEVTEEATAGTFYLDDAKVVQSSKLQPSWVNGLTEALQDLLGRVQLVVDTVVNALRGTAGTVLHTFEELAEVLRNINPVNILGWFGAANIPEAFQNFLDAIVGGAVGQQGQGASLADAFNVFLKIASDAAKGFFSWDILGIRTNKPINRGLIKSERSNFDFSAITDWFEVTQANSLIAVDNVEESMSLGVVSWIGKGTIGITEFYVNIYQVLDNGDFELVHHSPNIADLLSGNDDPGEFQRYELEQPIPIKVTEAYAYELVPVGGSHWVRGMVTAAPPDPKTTLVSQAAVRNNTAAPNSPPALIAKLDITRTQNVVWIGIAVDTGSGGDHHDPQRIPLTGQAELPIPAWANAVDLIAVGGAGGGRQGSLTSNGEGGDPGKWAAVTLLRDVDFSGTTIIEFNPGAGGSGGTGVGGKGGASTFTVGDYTLTAEGGGGGTSLSLLGTPVGRGPAALEYNGETYVAGADQKVFSGPGQAPGGAGNGGDRFFNNGGPGARGGGWVRFYRIESSDETPPPDPIDTTPPTPPETVIVKTTYSVITVRAEGGTDE
ncbi:minor tail protein [Mycobacterium phage Eureka]|uniref:Minor tail protein n=2 Tax=Kostyavirus eureka TaxID=1074306 RepID=G1JWP6_9CAUD|nr:minor tail protein [Mycobacterium phage Goku]YP_009591566.1 minor tail protein [Mycobacterium phage Eureka]AEL98044.1 minor tail protein [Mycobacterium phage Eureka]AGT14135.1 minor tail protein [Mycobacterium phage Goku]